MHTLNSIYTKLAVILLSCFCQYGLAQKSVTGIVTNQITNAPLEGVSIYIPEIRSGNLSGADGKFKIDNLPPATVHLQFTSIGYKSVVFTINTENSITMDVKLEPTAGELEEVLVISDNSKLPDHVPFPAVSISIDEIKKFGGPSLLSNLSYQPGLDRISVGAGIGKPVIRGLSFSRILLYGQGTRIENQQWDDRHDLGISEIGIENVEVVRGPAALIYGADALGGALIFVDEKPAPAGSSGGDANLTFHSNTLGLNADAGYRKTTDKGLFYGLRISGSSHTSYVQGEDKEKKSNSKEEEEFAPNSKFLDAAGKFNIGLSKKWGVSKLTYSFLNRKTGIVEDESADTVSVSNEEEEQREREIEAPCQEVTSHILSIENTLFTGVSKINLNLAWQLNDRKEYEPLPGKQKELAFGLKLNTFTYDLKWSSNTGKDFGVTIGSQALFLQNRNNGLESLVPDANTRAIGGFFMVRYDKKKYNLLGGIRYDYRHIKASSYKKEEIISNEFALIPSTSQLPVQIFSRPDYDFSRSYNPFSFSAGVAYLPGEDLSFKLNLATGFRAPDYAELATFGRHEGTYRFEKGYTDLQLEKNLEADLGIIWENKPLTITLNAFYNKVGNYIYIRNNGDSIRKINPDTTWTLPFYRFEQADATLKGGEFVIDFHPGNISWLDCKVSLAYLKGTLDKGGNLPYIPSGKLTGELKFSGKKAWKFKETFCLLVVSNYTKQKNIATYEISSDGYTLFDVHFGGNIMLGKHKTELRLFCTNLLNTAYFNQLSLIKNIGIHEMGRSLGCSLKFNFGN